MADDVKVTIGAESGGFSSEVQKVGKQIENLRNSGKKLGGVLEGDRRVENKLTSWVRGFAEARNAADLLSNTLGNLGDVFRTSLILGVGMNVGAELVQMFAAAMTKMEEMKKEANELGESLRKAFDIGSPSGLESSIESAREGIKKLKQELEPGFWKKLMLNPANPDALPKVREQRQADAGIPELEAQRSRNIDKLNEANRDALRIADLRRKGMEDEADYLEAEVATRRAIAEIQERGYSGDQQRLAIENAVNEIISKRDDKVTERQTKADQEHLDAIAKQQEKDDKESAERKKDLAKAHAEVEKEIRDEMNAEAERGEKERQERAKERIDAVAKMEFQAQEDEKAVAKQNAEEMAEFEIQKAKEVAEKKEEIAAKRALKDAQAQLPGATVELAQAEALMEQVQGQRQAAGDIGLFKRGASMSEQRSSQRFYQRQAEINAGVVARDEFRRKVGGDADKMAALKGQIEGRKQQILGEAGANNPEAILERSKTHLQEIERQITQLNNKLAKK